MQNVVCWEQADYRCGGVFVAQWQQQRQHTSRLREMCGASEYAGVDAAAAVRPRRRKRCLRLAAASSRFVSRQPKLSSKRSLAMLGVYESK